MAILFGLVLVLDISILFTSFTVRLTTLLICNSAFRLEDGLVVRQTRMILSSGLPKTRRDRQDSLKRVSLKIEIHEIHRNLRNPVSIGLYFLKLP